ncbi:LOB domain-containing protein 24-like [Cucurbita moschata]|uniref:LOB domain-containing protein 24-like n=1 Tax=Cucurbita moschata TaxID=3662 RepID=A0A6J1E5I6_CUCMO|nr:LOB domain-containing protein 24-like [Cucurbita moschata]
MISGRCAACKYLRRRCASDCIFSPFFPSNNPQRFAIVHRIYGASNVAKFLHQLPLHLRPEAAESLFFEAKCRIEDPVYGCVGIISQLQHQLHVAETQLAKTRAEIAFLASNLQEAQPHDFAAQPIQGPNTIGFSQIGLSTPAHWFNS